MSLKDWLKKMSLQLDVVASLVAIFGHSSMSLVLV